VRVLEEAWNLLPGDVEAIFRIAESNLDALITVDLVPKRPFSVDESVLWARFTRPHFAAQAAAVVGLVEAPANHRKAPTVAKEFKAIKYGNTADHSIEKFLESPFIPEVCSTRTWGRICWIRSLSDVAETWWDAGGIFACPDTDTFSA
jgi:hypothetical protein